MYDILYGPVLYIMLQHEVPAAEVPSNVTVELGTPPLSLRCHHTSSDALITWIVNGSPLGQFPDIRPGSLKLEGVDVVSLIVEI